MDWLFKRDQAASAESSTEPPHPVIVAPPRLSLLGLPLEIRIMIYKFVFLNHYMALKMERWARRRPGATSEAYWEHTANDHNKPYSLFGGQNHLFDRQISSACAMTAISLFMNGRSINGTIMNGTNSPPISTTRS
jgi:hypothetical protein